jgi:hypothetical protein
MLVMVAKSRERGFSKNRNENVMDGDEQLVFVGFFVS